MYVIILKNVRTVKHKYELACGGDNVHIFRHIDHNKNQHYLCKMNGALSGPVYNPFLNLNQG